MSSMCLGSWPASFIARPFSNPEDQASMRLPYRNCCPVYRRRRRAGETRHRTGSKWRVALRSTRPTNCRLRPPERMPMPVEARAYPRPLPNPEWLGKLTEGILEPDLPIVDPHHHLWDHPGSRYLLDELLADVNSGHNIVATVFIQCGSGYRTSGPEEMRCIGESEFVRAIAEEADRRGTKTKICAGIVSFADLRLPNADAVLEGQIAAAGGRFRGIRQIAAYDPAIVGASSYVPPPDLMNDPNFRRGLKRLPAHDLTFEAWIYHPQIKGL